MDQLNLAEAQSLIRGFAGPKGSGKTKTRRMIFRNLQPVQESRESSVNRLEKPPIRDLVTFPKNEFVQMPESPQSASVLRCSRAPLPSRTVSGRRFYSSMLSALEIGSPTVKDAG